MKKIYGLLMVPVLALSGCVSKITKEEGIARAKEIAEHKVDASEIKALRIESKMKIEADLTEDKERKYTLMNVEGVTEFSRDKSFAHSLVKTETKSIYGKTTESDKGELESWSYVKDDVFVTAMRTVDEKGKESKVYTEVKSGAAAAFKLSLEALVKEAVVELQAKEYLASVQSMLATTDEEFKKEGAEYKIQAYSGGEGSLVVKGSFTLTKYEGYEGKGSGSVKYAWDNYLLQEINVQMKAEANDKEKKATGSVELVTQEKVAFRCRVAQPNLKDYKKA